MLHLSMMLPLVALSCRWLPRALAKTQIELRVSHTYKSVDCVDRLVVATNGAIPAPTITVQPGEEVEVTVVNSMMMESLSMHWHGQVHLDSPWQDGSSMISSCPIPPMSSFVYKFKANNKPGLYQYHGHVGGIRSAGLGGNFVIAGEVSAFAAEADGGEKIFHLTDWFHATENQLVTGLLEPRFRWPGDPQSLLINGKGHFNCTSNAAYGCSDDGSVCSEGWTSAAMHSAVAGGTQDSRKIVCGAHQRPWYRPSYHPAACDMSTCSGYEKFSVNAGKTYLLRFTNGGTLSLFNVAIENHTMTVIEVDGEPTQKYVTASIDLNSGQRASVLVTMDQSADVYVLKLKTRARKSSRTNYVLIEYEGSARNALQVDPTQVEVMQPDWDDNNFTFEFQRAIRGFYEGPSAVGAVPKDVDVKRTFIMLVTQERMEASAETNGNPSVDNLSVAVGTGALKPQAYCDSAENTKPLRWLFGRRLFQMPQTPVLSKIYFDLNVDVMTEERGYYGVEQEGVYDMVIQNYPACNGVCETHAWHLHGMHFWVLGTGRGEWIGSAEQFDSLNRVDPPKRDTTQTVSEGVENMPFGKDTSAYAPCGWTYIRFVVASPGAWPFHCHQLWHMVMGQMAIFYTNASTIPAPPSNLLLCGEMTFDAMARELFRENTSTVSGSVRRLLSFAVATAAFGGLLLAR